MRESTARRPAAGVLKGRLCVVAGFCALAALLPSGCKLKDAQKCSDAQATARKAIASEQFGLARQWRQFAYKNCSDTAALGALDQEIVQAEANVKKRAAEAEAKAKADQQHIDLFTSFVSSNRGNPASASKNPECEDPAPGHPKKDRWCEATRSVGGQYQYHIRYYESDPKLARFITKLPIPMTCDKLGAHSLVREWTVPSTSGTAAKRQHCNMTGGNLAGMHVVVTEAVGADTHVFTQEYLDKDGWMQKYVGK